MPPSPAFSSRSSGPVSSSRLSLSGFAFLDTSICNQCQLYPVPKPQPLVLCPLSSFHKPPPPVRPYFLFSPRMRLFSKGLPASLAAKLGEKFPSLGRMLPCTNTGSQPKLDTLLWRSLGQLKCSYPKVSSRSQNYCPSPLSLVSLSGHHRFG